MSSTPKTSEHPQHQKVLEQVGLNPSGTAPGGSDTATPTSPAGGPASGPSWREEILRIHQTVVKRFLAGSVEDQRFLTMALAGEVGEFANEVKKEWRGDFKTDKEFVAWAARVRGEWADCRIYMELIAWAFGFDGDQAVTEKLQELYEKFNVRRP
jgi:NTP pyrophosphatase (non-canonical NTP hydrolase)